MIRCIVFDLDDTPYLERDYIRSGFRALEPWVQRSLGLKDFYSRAWTLFEQGARGHIFDIVLEAAGIVPDRNIVQMMVEIYRRHAPDIRLAADAAACLNDLRRRTHLALVSDGPQQSQENKIKALSLHGTFEIVVLTSALGNGYTKPNVRAFLDVQQYFGPAVQQFTYIADNPAKDFVGPRSLGWSTVRVRRNQGLYSHLEADRLSSADIEFSDLHPLISLVFGAHQLLPR